MNDTVRIERPLRCRRQHDLGGRAKQDSLGNPVKVRTRIQDSEGEITGSWLKPEVNGAKSPQTD